MARNTMPPFSIEQTIRISFGVIGRNWMTFLLFAILASAISYGVACDVQGRRADLTGMKRAARDTFFPVFVLLLVPNAVAVVVNALLVVEDQSLLAAFVRGWGPFLGYAAVLAMFWTAVPATALERPGFVSALRIGYDQSRGRRFGLFAMVLLIFVIFAAVGVALFFLLDTGRWSIFAAAVGSNALTAVTMAVSYFLLGGSGGRPGQEIDDEKILSVFD